MVPATLSGPEENSRKLEASSVLSSMGSLRVTETTSTEVVVSKLPRGDAPMTSGGVASGTISRSSESEVAELPPVSVARTRIEIEVTSASLGTSTVRSNGKETSFVTTAPSTKSSTLRTWTSSVIDAKTCTRVRSSTCNPAVSASTSIAEVSILTPGAWP